MPSVDAQVYFRVKSDEESVKGSIYNVNNYKWQIVNLARTTLRNIIGTLTLKSANSERGKINSGLYKTLHEETKNWGIEIVRTELKEIDPPRDVQDTMNKVVKAENEKIAAIDSATAAETVADGVKRAKIKEAEGYKQSKILHAEGEAEAIKLVNEAADKYFIGNAQLLRKLEAMEASLGNNAKIVIPTGSRFGKYYRGDGRDCACRKKTKGEMKKVLIALDFDPSAQKIAETGFSFAQRMKAEVTLLHVLANPQHYKLTEHVTIMGFAGHLNTSEELSGKKRWSPKNYHSNFSINRNFI